MSRLVHDVRLAFRSLRRKRFVSILAIAAFALGIGITTAVFTIFNSVILAPLPYPEPDRIVSVYDVQPACSTCPASFAKLIDWKTRNEVFSAIGGSSAKYLVITGDGEPERITAFTTTASLGDVLGVRPSVRVRHGRRPGPEIHQPSAPASRRWMLSSRSTTPRPRIWRSARFSGV